MTRAFALNSVRPGEPVTPTFPGPASRGSRRIVRPLEERDLDAVARLFLLRFRQNARQADERAVADVASYMRELYFGGPDCKAGTEATVLADARGEIGAFLGLVPTTYQLDGKPLKAAISGAFMAAPGQAGSLAGIQLLRETLRRPFDLIFADTANRTTVAVATAMKYKILSPDSLEWAHVFKPAGVVLHKLHQRWPWTPAAILRPFAQAADMAAAAMLRKKFDRGHGGGCTDVAIEASAFVELAPQFLAAFRLRPEWSSRELTWFVAQASLRQSAGPLNFRLVQDSLGKPIGCYAFFGEKGGVARVIHAAATGRAWGGFLAKILDTTEAMGCLGVHGAARKEMMPHIHSFPGMFLYCASGVMAFSNRKDVMECVENGDAFIGGFAGDRWTRLATDKFGLHAPVSNGPSLSRTSVAPHPPSRNAA